MIRTFTLLSFFLAAFNLIAQQVPDWENPGLQQRNVLPPHAYFIPYPGQTDALKQAQSPLQLSLDGIWKFNLVNTPDKRPLDFFKDNFSAAAWKNIKVPSNWQTEGYDTFIFTDVEYPIPPNPPYVPKDFNPVGSYKRIFSIPEGWQDKEIILNLGAVNSFFYVWINGQEVGMSKDSKTPAAFNITSYLHKGENSIALQVFRFSDGTYLEGQDMWKLSGIERSVYLLARPKLRLEDFFVKAGLVNNYQDGRLNVQINLNKMPQAEEQQGYIEVKLLDASGGQAVFAQKQLLQHDSLNITGLIPKVQQWNAESPRLYQLLITQYNQQGQEIESLMQEIGFRNIEIVNGLFKINGVVVKIKGVNRHEHDMYTGKVISVESMKRDLELMKQYHINAVRCSHYPNAEEWYQLCNRYGIYVVDEANIECDGMDFHEWKTLANRPEWKEAFLNRTRRMVQRDKNFSSIVTWSLGNESRFGENFEATYRYIKSVDNTRPVQYEEARDNDFTDIYCPMYKSLYTMLEYSKEHRKRPLIQCEYAHMMGNSGGNFKDDWDVFYSHEQLQGGFIWDFSDQAFKRKDKNGNEIWAYGKDLGKVGATSDTSFCADGMFAADRTPHPQAFEVKKVYQNIDFKPVAWSRNELEITNRFDFSTLDDYQFTWKVECEGKVMHSGNFQAKGIAPHQTSRIKLDLPPIAAEAGAEYFLKLEAWSTKEQPGIPSGYMVAEEQFKLPEYKSPATIQAVKGKVNRQENQQYLNLIAGKVKIVFDKKSGLLSQYFVNSVATLKEAMRPNFWRAATDNDIGASLQIKTARWQFAAEHARLTDMQVKETDSSELSVSTRHYLPEVNSEVYTSYKVRASGDVHISMKLVTHDTLQPEMPRIGLRCILQPAFTRFSWLGRGPFDNYVDRKYAAHVGLYQTAVDSLFHPYARAQESANRTDIRWMALQNKAGIGLMAIAPYEHWLSGGALHFSMHDLDFDRKLNYNKHGGSMKSTNIVWWNIDYAQAGVGGDNSWGAKPHAEYTLPYYNYYYEFTLRPLFNYDLTNEAKK